MNQPINLIAFGTFGSPNGFKQTFFEGNSELAKKVKTFDLNTNAIKLFPKSKIYAVRKEMVSHHNAVAYMIYTFAKEQNSDRGGTFIGSGILFTNKIAVENITINLLNSFHNNLISRNVENDIITVNHSDNFLLNKLNDVDKAEQHLKEIGDVDFEHFTNRNLVVYCITSAEKLQQLFKKSIDLLNVYDTIYFTDSDEIATFVNQKGIFKVVTSEQLFEQEIANLTEDRKQKMLASIAELEIEKQKLEADKKKLLEGYRNQIEQNLKLHEENNRKIEESKIELDQISEKYAGYSKKIEESINNLKSGKKPEAVRQLHNENKKIFIDSIHEQKAPKFISKISKPVARTDLKQFIQPKAIEQNSFPQKQQVKRNTKLDIFKISSFALSLLWIATLVYFLLFRNTKSNTEQTQPQEHQLSVIPQPKVEPAPIKELNPKPNAELSENDYKRVAKKINKNMLMGKIVQVIFEANPTDIKNIYATQLEEYANKIFELNKDCFKKDSSRLFFVKDTLRHIPIFKK